MDDTAAPVGRLGRPGFSRRRFLAGLATAASAAAGATGLVLGEGTAQAAGARLPIPELLAPTVENGVRVFRLRAAFGTHELLPGVESHTAGFNGPYLGPTLRVREGERVRFEVANRLGEDLAVHWHGAHVPPKYDGGVHAVFPSGMVWKPEFTIMQEAASLWYHPHTMHRTARQLSWGLAGMLIVQDDSEAGARLPGDYGVDDIPVVLQSVAVAPDGAIKCYAPEFTPRNVTFPMVVNGANVSGGPLTFTATRGRVRLRLLNASISEVLTVRRTDGRSLVQVATDAALLPRPMEVGQVRLSAACRAEIVVDVARETQLEVTVQTEVGRGRNSRQTFLTLLPGSSDVDRLPPLPSRLNTIRRYDVSGLKPRVINLTERGGELGLNGISATSMKLMDANEIVVREGDLELWEVRNRTPRNHSFHIHDVPFQLVSLDGRPPRGIELGWRDTVEMPRGSTVRLAVRFTDFASERYTYMLHCHIVEHEDLGMMLSLKVRPR